METMMPYFYGLIVFALVIFLFILLGRMLMNVETIYFYEFERITKIGNQTQKFDEEVTNVIRDKGKKGWKLDHVKEMATLGEGSKVFLFIFVKTKSKVKIF